MALTACDAIKGNAIREAPLSGKRWAAPVGSVLLQRTDITERRMGDRSQQAPEVCIVDITTLVRCNDPFQRHDRC